MVLEQAIQAWGKFIPSFCKIQSLVFLFQVKQKENDIALKCYQKVIRSLDTLGWEDKQFALVKGLLAGNVFDWGAKAVSE